MYWNVHLKTIPIYIELAQMVRVLVSLNMWSGVQFLNHMYVKNLVGRGKFTLYIPQIF
jgi:hypothetical protein